MLDDDYDLPACLPYHQAATLSLVARTCMACKADIEFGSISLQMSMVCRLLDVGNDNGVALIG